MLTIISVSYKSKALLEANYRLVKALNPGTAFRWLVVQNTPASALGADLPMDDSRFEMIRGPVLTEFERQSMAYGSFHHAKALTIAANYTDADLILTLDPDCFVLKPNWINQLTQHVQRESLAFWGTPYHPRNFKCYRDFPNVIFMLINRRLLQESHCFTLDFMPQVDHRRFALPVIHAVRQQTERDRHLLGFFLNWEASDAVRRGGMRLHSYQRHPSLKLSDWRIVLNEWLSRYFPQLKVGTYGDTGIKLFQQYHSSSRHQQLEVYARDERTPWTKLLESILPDCYRTFPRNRGHICLAADPFLKDFDSQCEQFYWNNEMFAFHVNATWYSEEFRVQVYARLLAKVEEVIARASSLERGPLKASKIADDAANPCAASR